MIVERLVIVIIAFAIGILAWYAWQAYLARRTRRLAQTMMPADIGRFLPPGPALLYFTTPTCTQCRWQQAPILTQLAQSTGVTVYTFDAVEQGQLAHFFGIMTVPTTVWLDARQRPSVINHGLAKLSKLQQQAALLTTTA